MPTEFNSLPPDVRNAAWDQVFYRQPAPGGPLDGVATLDQVDYKLALDHLSRAAATQASATGAAGSLETPTEVEADYAPVYARLAMMDPAQLTGQMKEFMNKFDDVFTLIPDADLQQYPSLQALGLVHQARSSADPTQMQKYRDIYDELASKPDLSLKDMMLLFFKAVMESQRTMQQLTAQECANRAYEAFKAENTAADHEQTAADNALAGACVQATAQAGSAAVNIYGARRSLETSKQANIAMGDASRARAAAAQPNVSAADAAQHNQTAELESARGHQLLNDSQAINNLAGGQAAAVSAIGTLGQGAAEKAASDEKVAAARQRALGALEQGEGEAAKNVMDSMTRSMKDSVDALGGTLKGLTSTEAQVAQLA